MSQRPTIMHNQSLTAIIAALATALCGGAVHAATLSLQDVTSNLGPDFFIDDAQTGGNNNDGTFHAIIRDFGPLDVGPDGSLITITGIGFGMPAAGNQDGNEITANFFYLGADGVNDGGGGDDVMLGSASFTHDFDDEAGEYGVVFDSPLIGVVDGLNSIFRVAVFSTSDQSIRIKNDNTGSSNPSGQSGRRVSIAGTSEAFTEVIPTPAALPAGLVLLFAMNWIKRRP